MAATEIQAEGAHEGWMAGVKAEPCPVSVVAVPKPFRGHIGVIQMNALRSWAQLPIAREILLIGDEEGVSAAAAEAGVRHIGPVRKDGYGTPLLDDVFRIAEQETACDWLCYVNGDIILMPEFAEAVSLAKARLGACLVTSRRWNLKVADKLPYDAGWQSRLRLYAERSAELFSPYGLDVFVFPKGLFGTVPPFALGRSCWDNWIVAEARQRGYPVVDATGKFGVIHQEHGYDGFGSIDEIRRSQQGLRNYWLAGDNPFHVGRVEDATHLVSGGKLVASATRTVSVVVPHAGTMAQLRQCLRALSSQSYPRTFVEVIVVENADDSTNAQAPAEFPFIKLTRERKPGPAAARNKGAAIASGQVIAFLDSDCRPSGDWIAKLMAAVDAQECRSVTACNIKPGIKQTGSGGVQWYEAVTFHEQQKYVEGSLACISGAIAVPCEVWRRVGPFDDSFVEAACEDWEWSTRASAKGIRISYAPEAVVTHPVHRKWRELKKKSYRLVRGELRLARKRRNRAFLNFGTLCKLYTRRWLHELAIAMRDGRIPARHRLGVAVAATLVWFWSLREARRALEAMRWARRPRRR